jgi:SAM-dependent methyltransferase
MFAVVDAYQWQGVRVLEVGCGQGPLANHLLARGATVVAIDMSAASLRRTMQGSAELGHRSCVRVMQADAERLPFADASFDAVVSFGVLHHTPDTAHAVGELLRVLRPGGRATVMLYRRGNPKWFATRALRGAAHWLGRRRGAGAPVDRTRCGHAVGDARGTALLELFGVPTLKAFSNHEARTMFVGFADVRVRNFQAGFRRLADMAPILRPLSRTLALIDHVMEQPWGFYQVIEARRPSHDSAV